MRVVSITVAKRCGKVGLMVDLDALEKQLEVYKNFLWSIEKRMILTFWALIKVAIQYSFMLWIYLTIYDMYGMERTAIALAVGVILFGIRLKIGTEVDEKWKAQAMKR